MYGEETYSKRRPGTEAGMLKPMSVSGKERE